MAGNCDSPQVNPGIPVFDLFTLAKVDFALVHDIDALEIVPAAAGVDVVVYGHTHQADISRDNDVLYVNPGSAGPKRYGCRRSVAFINISASEIDAGIVEF